MSSEDDCPGDRLFITRKDPGEVLDELVKVYQEAYKEHPEYAVSNYDNIVSYFYSLLEIRPEGFLVVMLNGNLVGFAVEGFYQLNGERIGEIMEIAVSPRAKGKGLGKKLLHLMLDILSRYDCEKIYLEVGRENSLAYQLYSKLGFNSFRDDGKWIHMVKDTQEAAASKMEVYQKEEKK